MLIIGGDLELIQQFKDEMPKVFEMTYLGIMQYFLGIEVKQSNKGKRILRYLKGTIDYDVLFTSSKDEEVKLIGYFDSD